RHWLAVSENSGELIIDTSYLTLTSIGIAMLRESGSLASGPALLQLGAGEIRYITFVFQFPLLLEYTVSDRPAIPIPRGKKNVQIRFGYGAETFDSFFDKRFPYPGFKELDATEKRKVCNKVVREEWQKTLLTEPVTIDFSTKK